MTNPITSSAGGHTNVNRDDTRSTNTSSNTRRARGSCKRWLMEDNKMEKILRNLPSGIYSDGIEYRSNCDDRKKLRLSDDTSDIHEGRWITVELVDDSEFMERNPVRRWEIMYKFDGIAGNSNKFKEIEYGVGKFNEVMTTVKKWVNDHIVNSEYPTDEIIENKLSEDLEERITQTYSEEINSYLEEFIYNYTRIEPAQIKVKLYSIENGYDDYDYYIQFRNPYNEETTNYNELKSEDPVEIEAKLEKDIYGVKCQKDNKDLILNIILRKYTNLDESELNAEIMSLTI
jgi:hypothetical protein